MKRASAIIGEQAPEQLMRDRDAVAMALAGQMAWCEPEVVQARKTHPGIAVYLFQDQPGYYMHVVMDDIEYARDYAARYELSLVARFDGHTWESLRGQG